MTLIDDIDENDTDTTYDDIEDLISYVNDHTRRLQSLNDPSPMSEITVDCMVANATYAKKRLDDIISLLTRKVI